MRISWRLVAGPALAAVFLVAPSVSLNDVHPPAEAGSVPLEAPAGSGVWVSPPLEIDATAAGLSWGDTGAPDGAWIRASDNGIDWGPWVELHGDPDHGPDPGGHEDMSGREGTDPIWVGESRFIQYKVDGSGIDLHAEYVETAGRNLSAWEKVRLFFSRISIGRRSPAVAQPDQPAMVSREEWGGDACLAGPTPERDYADRVQLLFIHHSDHGSNANGYQPNDGEDLVYAICSYHVNVREWSDIGYNFLVDKYGTIYEGRGGGVEMGVIGAHTGGFNSYSTGIAFLGDHTASAPTDVAQAALRRLAAWKLDLHHVDPLSVVTLESLGSSKYPEDTIVQFPAIAGHRDASITACPGGACYALLGGFRAGIDQEGAPKIYGGWPERSFMDGSPATGYEPVAIPFRFTEPMQWTLVVQDETGALMLRADGEGESGSVLWDGTVEGMPVPIGRYAVRMDAVPRSGAPVPRPSIFFLRVGFDPPFRDDEGSIHEPDIATISEAGITRGCGPELYCPSGTVTRWQMALFLTRFHLVAGFGLPDGSDQGFADLGELPVEQQTAINQLSQLGITRGTSPTIFDPGAKVTRWQMALFLTRLLAVEGNALPDGGSQGFTDIVDLPLEQQTAINQLRQMSVTNQDGEYHPDVILPRDQMASFLARSLRLVLPGVEG
jgi:hypothetical protein